MILINVNDPIAALVKITGLKPAFMRPPYGEYNNNVRQVAAENGQSVIMWNYDSGDSVGTLIAFLVP